VKGEGDVVSNQPELDTAAARRAIEAALGEDLGAVGDITSDAVVGDDIMTTGRLIAKQSGVICGLEVARLTFDTVDHRVRLVADVREGEQVDPGRALAAVTGPAKGILAAERSALNLLQHLSGIATLTAEAVARTAGTRAKILDTRKTLPGLRSLEKYAVAVGGGVNHRLGLFDGVLLKDNHIALAGGIQAAMRSVRDSLGEDISVEVEAETLDQVREAVGAGANVIMLDNMSLEMMTEAVGVVGGRAVLEASGGITLERVEEIAARGVDRISIGALTDAPRLDISLEIGT